MTTAPSSQTFALGEPSLADLICAIVSDPGLTVDRKRYWTTSVRQMALYLGRPPEALPARLTALSGAIARLHPDGLGVNAKTYANHKSNLRAALVWFAHGAGALARPRMAPAYRTLIGCLASRHDRDFVSPFLRFLTKEGVAPDQVDDRHLGAYAAERSALHFRPLKRHHLRRLARLWNRIAQSGACSGMPVLTAPARRPASPGCDMATLPEGMKADIERYLDLIGRRHRAADGRMVRGCAPATIAMRRRELEAVLRMAVKQGIPLSSLTSLADLVRLSGFSTHEADWLT